MPENDAAERAANFITVESTGGWDYDLIRDRIEHEQDAEGVAKIVAARALGLIGQAIVRQSVDGIGAFEREVADLIRKGRTDD